MTLQIRDKVQILQIDIAEFIELMYSRCCSWDRYYEVYYSQLKTTYEIVEIFNGTLYKGKCVLLKSVDEHDDQSRIHVLPLSLVEHHSLSQQINFINQELNGK